MNLLLAEDETDLSDVLTAMLERSGFDVDAVENGALAVDKARHKAYDLIILDVMMPVMDGFTAVKEIRALGIFTPVLFLTAKAEVDDRISGLDAGADDYLTKPFAMGELLARVRAMTRRRESYTPRIFTLGDTSIDLDRSELKCKNSISLAVKELKLMELFMTNPGISFDSEELLDRFWSGEESDADALWMYISFLRNKLRSVGSPLIINGKEGGNYTLTSS
ncbi:MAG: response regulator transcription factor [Lachnospiraceae bacterium]|nr:response regulator transcription factor [Lachnospiraceae bacterium]